MRKAITLALFAAFITANAQQWELTTAIKSRSKFPAVQMMNPTLGYALDNGVAAILRTRDGGTTWERMNQLSVNAPNAMHMWSEQHGIVVGSSGSIYRSTDGFESYTTSTGAYGTLRSVMFANDTLGLIGTDAGRIYRTTDGGDSWTLTTSGIGSSYSITDLAMPSADIAYACAYGVGVIRSTDGGLTWQPSVAAVPTGSRAMHFSDALTGVLVGNGGNIHRTSDGGATWVQANSGVTQTLLSITVQGNIMLVAGNSGNVLRSTDAGTTWTASTVGISSTLHQSITLSPEGVGITGTDGRIFGTSDFGATWQLLRLGTYHTFLNKVSFANGDTGVAVGYETSGGIENGLLRTVDGGRTWLNANGLGGLGVHLRPDGLGLQGGSVGANARTNDYFATRQTQGAPNVAIRATWCFGEYDHLVAGGYVNGGFYRTTNGGATWQHTPNGASSIFDLYFINEHIGFGVGGGGQIWKSSDAGHTWQQLPHSTANDQFSVFFLNEQVGWTVGANSGARTTDGGQTWINIPDIPGYAMMVHFTGPDTGYVVGNSGQTVRSVDGGATWQNLMPSITNAVINDAAYLDGELVLVGRFGDIYRGRVACPSIADVPLITSSGETLCTSTTGNAQWYLDGDAIPDGDTPCIEATQVGSYTVIVTDALGCVSATSAPFQVIHTGVASMESGSTRLVPNPASGRVRIERGDSTPDTLTLTDMQGRIVQQRMISGTDHMIDLTGLKPGVYLVRIATANGVETLRLVKE